MKIHSVITLVIVWGSIMAFLPSHAQQVVIKDGYTAISAEGYTQGILDDISGIFEEVPLNNLSATQKVKRAKRHERAGNIQISPLFIIAPTDIDASGNPVDKFTGMLWATAGGWSGNANTTSSSTPQPAMETGCPQYKGKDGTDASGTWRLPTNREIHLMNLLFNALNATNNQTGFRLEINRRYWSSTEDGTSLACQMLMTGNSGSGTGTKGQSQYGARCIKDLPAK